MAETAKILSPAKKVLLPDLNAGCSLADACPPERFSEFKKKYPDHLVITYVIDKGVPLRTPALVPVPPEMSSPMMMTRGSRCIS
jgi:hypothetical protein